MLPDIPSTTEAKLFVNGIELEGFSGVPDIEMKIEELEEKLELKNEFTLEFEEMPKGVATFLFELTGSLEQYYRSSDI